MDAHASHRTAQACEPCRRKKSKCTGERPVCSFCRRLKQPCSYKDRNGTVPRGRRRRQTSSPVPATETRLADLEASMKEVLDAFNVTRSSSQRSAVIQSLLRPLPTADSQDVYDFNATQWLANNTTLSIEVLVEIYIEKFHGQPLLLFDIADLLREIRQWPQTLFFSFFALTSLYSSYNGDVVRLVQIARHSIDISKSDIESCIANVQALCLLTLWEISHDETASASMHTGLAQALSMQLVLISQPDNLHVLRCRCSAFILASMYGKETDHSPLAFGNIGTAMSPPLPNSPIIAAPTLGVEWPQDMGIYALCIDLFALWGKAMTLSRSVQRGESTSFWSPQSQYHEVRAAVFEFETRMNSNHRLRESGFSSSTSPKIGEAVLYWKLWFTSQILFHAVQLVINHPFIQIINSQRLRVFQPPSFQQQTIDQTLLHAKWIVRLHYMRTEKGLEIDDPFLAHISAIVATAYAFFLDCKDPKIKSEAVKGFDDCKALVAQFAQQWHHLRYTCKLLEALAPTESSFSQRTARISWFWDLLNYDHSTFDKSPFISRETVNLQMTTQFTSPVDEADRLQSADESIPSSTPARSDIAQIGPDDANGALFLDLNTDFLTGTDAIFADTNSDFWLNFGQL